MKSRPASTPAGRPVTATDPHTAPSRTTPSRRSGLWLTLGACGLLLLLAWWGTAPVLNHPGRVFAFNDNNLEMGLSPSYAVPQAFLRVWDNQHFFGRANQQFPVIVFHLMQTLLGPFAMRREGVLLTVWLAGLAGYWLARQFGLTRLGALAGGLLLMLCGWSSTFPAAGLPTRTVTLIFGALALGWLRRGRSGGPLCDLVAGGFLGLAVAETADVGMLFALSLAIYHLWLHLGERRAWNLSGVLRAGGRLTLFAAASLVIAYQAIIIQFNVNIAGVSQGADRGPEARYDWATQWSLPKAETWSLFAADYHGASSRAADSPYWGGMGRSAGWEHTREGFRNYRLAGYAMGGTALLWLIWLYLYAARRSSDDDPLLPPDRRREVWLLGGLALLGLVLSWGRHFPLYRLFYALPYMGTIRNPDKWLGPFSLFAGLAAAMGADLLRGLAQKTDRTGHRPLVVRAGVAMAIPLLIALIGLLVLTLFPQPFLQTLRDQGYGDMAATARQQALAANAVLAAVLVVGFGASAWLLTGDRPRTPRAIAIGLAIPLALLTLELHRANRPFMIGQGHAHLSQPNPMIAWLQAHAGEGRVKLLPPQHPLFNQWRMTHLLASGVDLFDPVSVSRLSADDAAFFEALETQPVRLWQLGAMRHLIVLRPSLPELRRMAPGQIEERLTFGVAQLGEGQYLPWADAPPEQHLVAIVEYTGALPLYRFAPEWRQTPDDATGDRQVLDALRDPAINPARRTWVQGAEAPPDGAGAQGEVRIVSRDAASATLAVTLPAPGLLVHATKYDPHWKAWLNDEAVPLLRADFLFQAVAVPAGTHTLRLAYTPSRTPVAVSIAGRAAWLALLLIVSWRHRRRTADRSSPMEDA